MKNTDRYGGLSKIYNRKESVCKAPSVKNKLNDVITPGFTRVKN
jgi:hypothetical protein